MAAIFPPITSQATSLDDVLAAVRALDARLYTFEQATRVLDPEGTITVKKLEGWVKEFGLPVIHGKPKYLSAPSLRLLVRRLEGTDFTGQGRKERRKKKVSILSGSKKP